MLTPRLVNCVYCASIPVLLADIDCKLTDLANIQYSNIVFAISTYMPGEVIADLLHYKQILTYKLCNPDYCGYFTVEMIASRVKLLIHK